MAFSKEEAEALQERVKAKAKKAVINGCHPSECWFPDMGSINSTFEGWHTILGTCPSKSNSYRIGHKRLFKTSALIAYEASFKSQFTPHGPTIEGAFEFHVDAYYPNNRSDLDGCFKATLDLLQKHGAIKNDRYCVKIIARKFIDKERPRIEFNLIPV